MNQEQKQKLLPSVFISHGGVGFTLDPTYGYFKDLQKYSKSQNLFQRTKNVIIVSGHWEEKDVTVNLNPTPKMMHDHPFKWLYKYNFSFETNLELATKIKEKFEASKITTKTTKTEDIDHGTWGGLFALFDIEKHAQVYKDSQKSYSPKIVHVSLHSGMDTAFHHKMGQILNEFRSEDTMIIASGSSTHSFTYMRRPEFYDWSKVWEKYLYDVITHKDESYRKEQLFAIKKHQQYKYLHSSDDHFIPLLVSLGTSHNPGTLIAEDHTSFGIQTSYEFM